MKIGTSSPYHKPRSSEPKYEMCSVAALNTNYGPNCLEPYLERSATKNSVADTSDRRPIGLARKRFVRAMTFLRNASIPSPETGA